MQQEIMYLRIRGDFMDKVYIGNSIPSSYHYAIFGNGYIDLYNTEVLQNGTFDYYRIYTNNNGFYYKHDSQRYSLTSETRATIVGVTDNFCYRQDFPNIMIMTFIFVLFGIFLFNIISSFIRKGGLLGGLL